MWHGNGANRYLKIKHRRSPRSHIDPLGAAESGAQGDHAPRAAENVEPRVSPVTDEIVSILTNIFPSSGAVFNGPTSARSGRRRVLKLDWGFLLHVEVGQERQRKNNGSGCKFDRSKVAKSFNSGVVQSVARQPLELVILVRVQAPEPTSSSRRVFNEEREPRVCCRPDPATRQ